MLLYGSSGDGKSSLINAGLLPALAGGRVHPERIRVQPRLGEEIVVEHIPTTEDERGELLGSLLAPDGGASRVVFSVEAFEERIREACETGRPVLIFDQFEEIITLFEEADAGAVQQGIVATLVRLLRGALPVKLLFVFREDYLSGVKHLLAAVPELVDHALRLEPLSPKVLPTIIRGPFERHPGHFGRELDANLTERLCAAFARRAGSGDLSLSEVETVALRLWQSDDPDTLLAARGVQGMLEDYLGEALDAFPPNVRTAALALLAQMVTSAGTRNVISAADLKDRVLEEDTGVESAVLDEALERLESESKLVRRERRRDLYLYEITSEFLVPWINRRREGLRGAQERRRERRRVRILGTIAGALLILAGLVTALAVWALGQRSDAQRAAREATSLGLTSSAASLESSRPDLSLLLALEAYRASPRVEARSSALSALVAIRSSGVLAILHGHAEGVRGVAFSPDGRVLVSAGVDRTVRLWDARTHRALGGPLTGHADVVRGVAFSPDGHTLASGSLDTTVRLWDVRTHRQVGRPLRGHAKAVRAVAFSPDGRTLASAGEEGTVRLWNVRAGSAIGPPLNGHAGVVYSVAFSPDGRTLASAGVDGAVRFWDVVTHRSLGRTRPTGSLQTRSLLSVAFSPNQRTLAAAGADKMVRFWDVRTHKQVGRPLIGHRKLVYGVAFSLDGRTLASAGADQTVRLWDVGTHTLGRTLTGHTGQVFSVAFSPDGRTLASAGDDHTIRFWDARPHNQPGELLGHSRPVFSVAFSPDGRTLASASGDHTVRLWDTGDDKQVGSALAGHADTVWSVAFSPDGRTLASASDDRTVRLWNTQTHAEVGLPLGNPRPVYCVAFSPDGRTLASAGADRTIHLWDAATHKEVGKGLAGHDGPVYGLAFSPDGSTLASASLDRTIRLWDLATQQQLGHPLSGHGNWVHSVAFSPDGQTLASASWDSTVRLWDVGTQNQLGEALTGHMAPVSSVAFSPDGLTLASASFDKTVRLWDVSSRRPLGQPLTDDTSPLWSVAFSPDGQTLASASTDKTIRVRKEILWNNAAELQADVCSLVGNGLSTTEWAQYAVGFSYRRSCP